MSKRNKKEKAASYLRIDDKNMRADPVSRMNDAWLQTGQPSPVCPNEFPLIQSEPPVCTDMHNVRVHTLKHYTPPPFFKIIHLLEKLAA